jgi:hypothetical protein
MTLGWDDAREEGQATGEEGLGKKAARPSAMAWRRGRQNVARRTSFGFFLDLGFLNWANMWGQFTSGIWYYTVSVTSAL